MTFNHINLLLNLHINKCPYSKTQTERSFFEDWVGFNILYFRICEKLMSSDNLKVTFHVELITHLNDHKYKTSSICK